MSTFEFLWRPPRLAKWTLERGLSEISFYRLAPYLIVGGCEIQIRNPGENWKAWKADGRA